MFDAAPAYTIGIEEELMLLAPETLELASRAPEVLALMGGDPRFKLELPASQIEIITTPVADVEAVRTALRDARHALAGRTEGVIRPAAAGVHPFSAVVGELNRASRYEHTIREYDSLAARQLVCALQVHVSVGNSARALSVYNAMRSYLPLLAAVAANGPFYAGHDSGLASVRPKLAELLPRQGVPPAIDSWESYAQALAWGARAGAFPDPGAWWWELRLHPRHGTLELRVPDAQSTVAEAAAVAGVAHALVVWLAARHDDGEALPVHASWRIAENRWSACRHGVAGTMGDLDTGERRPTRARLHDLLDTLSQTARSLRAERALEHARTMVEINGAIAQRAAAGRGGAQTAARWIADRFLE